MATITETSTAEAAIPVSSLDPFHKLVKDLSDILGPSSGLDSADVDPTEIEQLMREYESKTSEWQKYALADYTRPYTRNLVDKGNGKSNLLILVWTPGKGSPIHDHADAHCVMKVLRGCLREQVYNWPNEDDVKNGKPSPPTLKKETIYAEDEVTYMSDDLGLHRVSNPDPERVAVSLHLYTPPHAATRGCHIFDEKTGKPSRVMQCQFSEFGKKC